MPTFPPLMGEQRSAKQKKKTAKTHRQSGKGRSGGGTLRTLGGVRSMYRGGCERKKKNMNNAPSEKYDKNRQINQRFSQCFQWCQKTDDGRGWVDQLTAECVIATTVITPNSLLLTPHSLLTTSSNMSRASHQQNPRYTCHAQAM